jgi:predicted ATPase
MCRFEIAARRAPIVIVFEDAHWADPSSLDVLGRLIDGIAGMRALLIVTFRPDFTLPWVGAPQVGLLTLNRLATRECRDMISQVAGPRQLPEAAVEAIIARSDGVPLFLEELTRAVMEVGTAAGLAAPSAMPDSVKVPSVLNVSLMARLDRLGPARQVAQIAAAIGREFSYELLAAVTAARDSDLTARLDGLVEAGIVLREGRIPHASFRFKHALIQRAAYGTLLHDARRELHARIVHAIERACPDIRAREPEILARHCFEAGLLRQAVDCWREAGELALRRSAVKEAVKHLGTALDVADRAAVAGDTLITSEDRLRLQTAYGHALLWAKDMQETVSVFARARELAANVSDARERFSAFYGLWAGTLMRGTIEPAQGLAKTFLGETEGLPGSGEFAMAQRVAGTTAWHRGDFVRARLHLERALASYDPDRDGGLTLQFGLDLEVANSVLLAATLWPMGDVDRARRLVEQVTAKAPASGHALTQVYAHTYTFIVAMMSGDGASAMVHAQAMLDLCREHALTHVDYAAICHGWARSRAGDRSEAVAETRAALARLRERGGSLGTPWCLSLLAEVEWAAGEIESSLATVDASLAEAQRTGEHWYSAESERLRGEIRLARDPSNTGAAEDSFRAALAIAQQQKAKNFAIRAALSLARLQAGAGRRSDAVSVLALALTGPAPREELTEIGEARALLAKLRMSGST